MKASKTQNERELSYYSDGISLYLRNLRFKSRLFGLDSQDVWKKIEKLNEMYETALFSERARYNALLEAHRDPASKPDQPDSTL